MYASRPVFTPPTATTSYAPPARRQNVCACESGRTAPLIRPLAISISRSLGRSLAHTATATPVSLNNSAIALASIAPGLGGTFTARAAPDLCAHPPDDRPEPFRRGKWRDRVHHVIVGKVKLNDFYPRAVEDARDLDDLVVGLPTTLATIALWRSASSRIAAKCSTPRFFRFSGASSPATLHDLNTSAPDGARSAPDLAALGRVRTRSVHYRRIQIDAAKTNRRPFHFLLLPRDLEGQFDRVLRPASSYFLNSADASRASRTIRRGPPTRAPLWRRCRADSFSAGWRSNLGAKKDRRLRKALNEIRHPAQSQLRSHCHQAEREFPFECCGFIVGTNAGIADAVEEVHPITNIQNRMHAEEPIALARDARTAFLMEPREHLAVMNEIDRRRLSLRAVYHSHPDHDAYFSATDRAQACSFDPGEPDYPDTVYIVISVRGAKFARAAAFRWDPTSKDFVETELETN